MARILAYTTPARGHLFPLTPILDELTRRGHEIALRTLASQVPLMQGRGFDTRPIDERVEAIEIDDWRAGNPQAALARAVRCFLDRAEYDGPDLRQAIADERPDALLVDINSWGGLAATEAWGGPWATFAPFQFSCGQKTYRPSGPGWPQRGGRSAGCATACCAQSCSERSSGGCCQHSTTFAAGWASPRSRESTTCTSARRWLST